MKAGQGKQSRARHRTNRDMAGKNRREGRAGQKEGKMK